MKTCEGKRIFLRNAIFDDDRFQELVRLYGAKNINDAYKEIKSIHSKQQRILEKIQSVLLVNSKHWFVTLTLEDEYLNKSSRFLRDHITSAFYGCDYCFNEDYGEKRGRLHFHGVLACNDSIDNLKLRWTLGHCDFQLITSFDDKPLMKYIYKLRNHAIKDSTHKSRIITNRLKRF